MFSMQVVTDRLKTQARTDIRVLQKILKGFHKNMAPAEFYARKQELMFHLVNMIPIKSNTCWHCHITSHDCWRCSWAVQHGVCETDKLSLWYRLSNKLGELREIIQQWRFGP